MPEEQLELDLRDKFQKFHKIAKDMVRGCGSGQSVQIYSTHKPDVFWLGIRTFVYDTDHDYIHKIDFETAKYLIFNVQGVRDYFNKIRERIAKETVVTCKVCGCEKTKEELKQTHSTCFTEEK